MKAFKTWSLPYAFYSGPDPDNPTITRLPDLHRTRNGYYFNNEGPNGDLIAFGRGDVGWQKARDWYRSLSDDLMATSWKYVCGSNHERKYIGYQWRSERNKNCDLFWYDPVVGWQMFGFREEEDKFVPYQYSRSTFYDIMNNESALTVPQDLTAYHPSHRKRDGDWPSSFTDAEFKKVLFSPSEYIDFLDGTIPPIKPDFVMPSQYAGANQIESRMFWIGGVKSTALWGLLELDGPIVALIHQIARSVEPPHRGYTFGTQPARPSGFGIVQAAVGNHHEHEIVVDLSTGQINVRCGYEEDDEKYGEWLKREIHGFVDRVKDMDTDWIEGV